ncbi:MAG: hypothetical protein ACYCYP_13910 [Leptospirales bacterium]
MGKILEDWNLFFGFVPLHQFSNDNPYRTDPAAESSCWMAA